MFSNSLEGSIIRYKTIYTTAALILGLVVTIGGYRLGSLNGQYVPSSHYQVTGWVLHVFGCAILYNGNNTYPSLWLVLIGSLTFLLGLFTMLSAPYGIRSNSRMEAQDQLDRRALRSTLVRSIVGLFLGLFATVYAITFMESGINLCPADLVPDFEGPGAYICLGPIIFLAGIVVIVATRYRIRIHEDPEIAKPSKG